MRLSWLLSSVVLVVVVMAAPARAQVGSAQPAMGSDTEQPPPSQQPIVPPPQQPTPPPQPPPTTAPAATAVEEHHPEGGIHFAIGLGYLIGAQSVEVPNVTSVRLRLPTGLTFEPLVTFTNDSQTTTVNDVDSTTKITDLGVGALVRYPLIRGGRLDFEIVGDFLFDYQKTTPPVTNEDSSSTTFQIAWGVALQYWITRHWDVSLTGTNAIFTYTQQDTQMGAGMDMKMSDSTFGIVFAPVITAMIHLYN